MTQVNRYAGVSSLPAFPGNDSDSMYDELVYKRYICAADVEERIACDCTVTCTERSGSGKHNDTTTSTVMRIKMF